MDETGLHGSPEPGESEQLPARLVDELLGAAIAAPSEHNTQPWRFAARLSTIELRADPDRLLPVVDPGGRGMFIACGAALFNLSLAARVAGREPEIQLLPDPAEPLLVATVRLARPYQATPAERELRAAIALRHTNRAPFSGHSVPPGVLAELADAAEAEGAVLHFLDREEAARVLCLVRDAERAWMGDRRYRAELAQWAGGSRDRDGMPDGVLGPRDPDRAAPVREFAPGRPAPAGYAWFEENPQLVMLSTRFSGQTHELLAGQALQRVLLTATARGISASPLTQPFETGQGWLLRDARSGREQPQMILRIGYGLPVPSSPRRPVSEVRDE